MPIKFASQDRVNAHAALLEDFIERILGLEWALASDESSLWDFTDQQELAPLFDKIREVYSVDVSDTASGNLADILERIAASLH